MRTFSNVRRFIRRMGDDTVEYTCNDNCNSNQHVYWCVYILRTYLGVSNEDFSNCAAYFGSCWLTLLQFSKKYGRKNNA